MKTWDLELEDLDLNRGFSMTITLKSLDLSFASVFCSVKGPLTHLFCRLF